MLTHTVNTFILIIMRGIDFYFGLDLVGIRTFGSVVSKHHGCLGLFVTVKQLINLLTVSESTEG